MTDFRIHTTKRHDGVNIKEGRRRRSRLWGSPVLPPGREGSREMIPLGRRAAVRERGYHRRGGEAGMKQAPELLSRHDPRSRGGMFHREVLLQGGTIP